MKLRDLEAKFLTITNEGEGTMQEHESLDKAQGIMFLCPKCFKEKDGRNGTHSVLCWFNNRGVPASKTPGPGRWNPSGTGLDDLTFVEPGAVSVQLNGGCNWHGFIRNGDAE